MQLIYKPTVGVPHGNKGPKFVEVYGHRGARSFCAENTIPSYHTSLAAGSDWIDVDIGITADGVIVASHDPWLNPDIVSKNGVFWAPSQADFLTANRANLNDAVQPYLIHNLTFDELQTYEFGIKNPQSPYGHYFPDQLSIPNTKLPSLQSVIDYAKKATNNQINYQIEIKNDPTQPQWTVTPKEFAADLYQLLVSNGLVERVEIQAFDWNCLYELQKLDKRIKTAYLFCYSDKLRMVNPDPTAAGLWSGGKLLKDYNNSFPQMVKALGGSCYEPEDVTLTKEELDEAHQLGLKVVVWSWPERAGQAFDPKLVSQLIDWGVDGIITDDPGRLVSMLAARGLR